jgi:thiamine biosynthesis lipoprotein
MRKAVTISLLSLLVILAACTRKEVAEKTFLPMGGIPFTVKAYDVPDNVFQETLVTIEAETERLEQLFSTHREGSELSKINRAGSGDASEELLRLVRLASRISAETDGAFDITVGPLLALWQFCAQQNRMPTEEEIRQRLQMVDWRQVATSSRGTITLKRTNMSIELGGIAKGFMADAAAQLMKAQGIRRGIVDAGGDLVLFNSVGEDPFRVGIANPDNPTVKFAIMELDKGAVVTSGCYERNFTIQERKLCHIFDPRSGQPVDELASATIVAEEAATADALATAVMVLGVERGQAVINSLPGVEGVLIWRGPKGLEWWLSAGLQGKVRVQL